MWLSRRSHDIDHRQTDNSRLDNHNAVWCLPPWSSVWHHSTHRPAVHTECIAVVAVPSRLVGYVGMWS